MLLDEWLGAIDLSEYEDKLKEIGASKIDHLHDIEEQDLRDIGMRPLEIRRFQKKLHAAAPSTLQRFATEKEVVKSQLPCPSLVGRQTINVPVVELIKDYGELYYEKGEEHLNFKQRESNNFVLQMLSSASWRFQNKRALFDWGREERMNRIKVLIAIAPDDKIMCETKYFKDQSLLFQVAEWKKKFREIMFLFD